MTGGSLVTDVVWHPMSRRQAPKIRLVFFLSGILLRDTVKLIHVNVFFFSLHSIHALIYPRVITDIDLTAITAHKINEFLTIGIVQGMR